mmetsp:Transcript_86606/g.279629  ORF Transcript_86606/g.279629 Transcript_86606/m.279629 type:complete len:217 (-) Transcript_86606:640-1290(-)
MSPSAVLGSRFTRMTVSYPSISSPRPAPVISAEEPTSAQRPKRGRGRCWPSVAAPCQSMAMPSGSSAQGLESSAASVAAACSRSSCNPSPAPEGLHRLQRLWMTCSMTAHLWSVLAAASSEICAQLPGGSSPPLVALGGAAGAAVGGGAQPGRRSNSPEGPRSRQRFSLSQGSPSLGQKSSTTMPSTLLPQVSISSVVPASTCLASRVSNRSTPFP